jgi:hypothetical protein
LFKSVPIILFFAFLIGNSAFSQKLQVGIMGRAGAPFLLLTHKNFDKSCFKYIPSAAAGLGFEANYYIQKKYNIYTGVNLQLKSYAARLYNFNVPNVKGFVSHRPTIASLELPVVLNYEKKRKKADHYINYGFGAVLSMNKALLTTVRQHGPLYSEETERDSLFSGFSSELNKANYFSYDLYAGISFVRKIKQRRLLEWGISYQYAFSNSAKMNVDGFVKTSANSKIYNAVFNPKLSFIALHLTFYPKHFVIL